jgi:hypothetical protein
MDQIHAETMEIVRKAGARIREENFRLANEMLVALMGSSNDAVKLAAIKEILDRVEGKPKENIMLDNQDIYELPPQDRWKLIPYEIKLRLSRDFYSKETTEMITNWATTGKVKPKKKKLFHEVVEAWAQTNGFLGKESHNFALEQEKIFFSE